MAFKDTARFYRIDGRELPSVTTILQVVNKPAIGPWMAKMERHAFELAMIAVAAKYAARGEAIPPGVLVDEVLIATTGVKAGEKARDAQGDIGTQAHAMIEWITRTMLKQAVGPEPVISDPAWIAVESWKDWAKGVTFLPLLVEPVVHHAGYGYAGRADVIAECSGDVTLVDYKSGKAVYPEAHLQITAYRHAAAYIGILTRAGVILRLPKTLADPSFDGVNVPDQSLDVFLAALQLWRWQRGMAGQAVGG